MREFVTSVLAGLLSAMLWEFVRWVLVLIGARKNPPSGSSDERV